MNNNLKNQKCLYLHVNNFCHARSTFGQLYLIVHQRMKYLGKPKGTTLYKGNIS